MNLADVFLNLINVFFQFGIFPTIVIVIHAIYLCIGLFNNFLFFIEMNNSIKSNCKTLIIYVCMLIVYIYSLNENKLLFIVLIEILVVMIFIRVYNILLLLITKGE